MEKEYLNKSIEELENDYWKITDFQSSLVEKIYQLRKKRIGELDLEELRSLISQNFGLQYLIPLGIQALENNILIECEFYPGDLLEAILQADPKFWLDHIELKSMVNELLNKNHSYINSSSEINADIKRDISKHILAF